VTAPRERLAFTTAIPFEHRSVSHTVDAAVETHATSTTLEGPARPPES
jgi:hypothetical protein